MVEVIDTSQNQSAVVEVNGIATAADRFVDIKDKLIYELISRRILSKADKSREFVIQSNGMLVERNATFLVSGKIDPFTKQMPLKLDFQYPGGGS